MNKNFEALPWDTEFFGVGIGRIHLNNARVDELSATVHEADESGIRCLYWLVDCADLACSHSAAQFGFRLVDIRITFERPLGALGRPLGALGHPLGALGRPLGTLGRPPGAVPSEDHPNLLIRAMTAEDFPALAAIARGSHRDSRFFADGHFSAERCEALYEEWLRKSRTVLVGEVDGQAAGYCSCDVKEGGTGSIGLIAVDPRFRRVSLGKSLVEGALEFFRKSGMHTATVVTQGQNSGSQRLYQRCGFVTKSIQLWYHRWIPESASL